MEFERTYKNIANPDLIIEVGLSREFADGVLWTLAEDVSLVQDESLDTLVQSFATPASIDAYQVVGAMAQTAPVVASMLGGKTGVRESYRLHEHTQAVLNGFEADYADAFPDPDDRKLLRTTLLLQDMGKSLCIAHCGDRRKQSPYNVAVVDNLLASIAETTLDADDKQTIRLLLNHDILGSVLKGYKGIEESVAQAQITELKQFIPEKYQGRYLDLMRVVYMADVSAYTDYRSYVNAEDGQKTSCLPALNKEYEVLTADPDSGKVIFKEQAKNDLLARLTNPI